ncbi:MAG: mevalonate kinase [Anaerolineales bacterium]|nr:mevalonate kinase [Anaerolineales bacterium]
MTLASASGKAILFGEHAVVYGQPAIAVPLSHIRVTVQVENLDPGTSGVLIDAPDIHQSYWLHETDGENPLASAVNLTLDELSVKAPVDVHLTIRSQLPIASGLGSSAAVSVAIIRALSAHLAKPLEDETVSKIAYTVECIHHGTPSGIDNTVVAYEKPVYFIREHKPELIPIFTPLNLIIGDTGESMRTTIPVSLLRERWEKDPGTYGGWFAEIGEIVIKARTMLETGSIESLGALMDQNQTLLEDMGLSSLELQRLIREARKAGALGAKLSGAGMGGIMLALVEPDTAQIVETALRQAGAKQVITTEVDG